MAARNAMRQDAGHERVVIHSKKCAACFRRRTITTICLIGYRLIPIKILRDAASIDRRVNSLSGTGFQQEFPVFREHQ